MPGSNRRGVGLPLAAQYARAISGVERGQGTRRRTRRSAGAGSEIRRTVSIAVNCGCTPIVVRARRRPLRRATGTRDRPRLVRVTLTRVPSPFRDSFLARNQVNVELIAIARRLVSPPCWVDGRLGCFRFSEESSGKQPFSLSSGARQATEITPDNALRPTVDSGRSVLTAGVLMRKILSALCSR